MSSNRNMTPSLLALTLVLALVSAPALRAQGSSMARIGFATPYHVLDSQLARDAVLTADGFFVLAGNGSSASGPGSGVGILIKASSLGPEWIKTYGGPFDRAFYGVTELADGSLVAAGYAFTSIYAGDERIWIVKTDRDGNLLWEKTFGFPNEQNDAYAMTRTADGGFIVTGIRLRHATAALPETWVLKFDADGNLQWDRTFRGGLAHAIVQATDGSYVLTGGQPIAGSLNSRVWAIKIDASGRKVWEQVYDQQVYVLLQSGLAETPDGGFLISGKEFIQKVDANGLPVWIQQYYGFEFNSVALLPDGNVAVAGIDASTNNQHAYVAVFTPGADKLVWANSELLQPSGFTRVLTFQGSRHPGVAVAGWVPTDASGANVDMVIAQFWQY